ANLVANSLTNVNGTLFFAGDDGIHGNELWKLVDNANQGLWDGGGADNNWSTAANWVGDVVPNPGDDLVFGPSAARLANINDLAGMSFHPITFSAGGYWISGNGIPLTGGGVVNSAGSNTLNLPITLSSVGQAFVAAGSTSLNLGGAINNGGVLLT